jgi:protein TonB
MFTQTRALAITTSLLLSVFCSQAWGAEQTAKIDREACDAPGYRLDWVAADQRGDVVLSMLVNADGKVTDAKVVESSGYAKIDKASLRAGSKCKFSPGTRNGEAVPSWVKIRYSWVIN